MWLMLLGEFGFTASAMLFWSVAAAIPLIIHLLRKRRQHIVQWAAMQMLQKVLSQQSRRTRLQQLLLLLIRVVALILLAAALARPFLSRPASSELTGPSRSNKVWILLIDTSYSMDYRTGGATRLDLAKQRLSKIVQESQTGDAFALVVIDDPSRAIISQPTLDAQGTLHEIQQLTETACGCNVQEALTIASNIAKECKNSTSLPHDIEVIVASDMGLDAWQALESTSSPVASRQANLASNNSDTTRNEGSTASSSLRTSLDRLGQLATVRVDPLVDSQPIANVAIEAMITSTSRPVVGNSITVDITVAAYGNVPKQVRIQFEQDGQVVASQIVDTQSGSKTQVRFQAAISTPGSHSLSASIPSDNLQVDNRFDLIVEATQGNRTLVVQSGSSSKNPWQIALQSGDENLSDHSIRLVSDLAFNSEPLAEFDLIILDNCQFNSLQLDRLSAFVEAGGAAIANWGSRSSITRSAAESTALRTCVGFDFQAPSEEGDWSVDPLEYRSPIVAPFSGFPNSGLLTTPIFRYWRTSNPAAELITDVALSSGDPWIVRHRFGKGWVASVLSAPESGQSNNGSTAWNAITTWPSFLPLAQQLVQTISDSDRSDCNRTAGQAIGDRMPKSSMSNSVRLVKPDRTEVSIMGSKSEGSNISNWSYANTSQRGIYRVLEPHNYDKQFAVNIDPKQSSLAVVDAELYRKYIEPNSQHQSTEPSSSANDDRLARWLLGLLLVVLICETILAWSLGRLSQ